MLVMRSAIQLLANVEHFQQPCSILLQHWHPWKHDPLVRLNLLWNQQKLEYTIAYFDLQYLQPYIGVSSNRSLNLVLPLRTEAIHVSLQLIDKFFFRKYFPIPPMRWLKNQVPTLRVVHENYLLK